jgi:hypothetical protein
MLMDGMLNADAEDVDDGIEGEQAAAGEKRSERCSLPNPIRQTHRQKTTERFPEFGRQSAAGGLNALLITANFYRVNLLAFFSAIGLL